MIDFPGFMRSEKNRIESLQQNKQDITGYYYEGNDGGQMAFWTCSEALESKKHVHDFDEWMAVISAEYVLCRNDGQTVLRKGDEAFIPKGTEQWGRCAAGTRTIHAFEGRRITRHV